MQTDPISNPSPASTGNWLRRFWALLPTIVLIALIGLIVVLQSWIKSQGEIIKTRKDNEMGQAQELTNVVTLELAPALIREKISLPGVVRPWIALNVVAEVRGKIVDKRVREGQAVSRGNILAVIDDRDYKNAFASAQASYKAAKATCQRLQTLFENQVGTRAQLDDAIAQMETTKAAMDNAALNLERCTIRSPIKGVVDRLHFETGQYMNAADPIADVLQIERVKIEVGIPESDLDAVRRVQRFRATIDALNGRTFDGVYHYLAKSADSMARTYRLEIAVDNPEGEIAPDMFARVEIVKRRVDQGLAVPLYALVSREKNPSVYIADKNVARLQPVGTGIQEGWRLQLTQGVKPGDQVIVVGQHDLNDGDGIKVVRSVQRIEDLDR